MFALVLQGFGITVVALLGILGCIAHLKLFTGLTKKTVYDNVLAVSMAFNLLMLAAGFILISVSVYFDYAGHHSNSHIYILPWVMFAAWVGSQGSSCCTIMLCIERCALVYYESWHARIASKKFLVLFLVVMSAFSLLTSLMVVFEYDIICHGIDSPHENFLGACPEGQRAYVVYSDFRTEYGYRLFSTVNMLVFNLMLPNLLIAALNIKNYRQDVWRNPVYQQSLKTILSSSLMFVTNVFQIIPVAYEIHTLNIDLEEFHTTMPDWIMKSYQISHFLAMLAPALNPFIFSGFALLGAFCQSTRFTGGALSEPLIVKDEEEQEDSAGSSISLE